MKGVSLTQYAAHRAVARVVGKLVASVSRVASVAAARCGPVAVLAAVGRWSAIAFATAVSAQETIPVGLEFRVNTYTAFDQRGCAVTSLVDGSFTVVWESFADGSNSGVFGQRYDSGGSALGSEFQANTYTSYSQRAPAVAPQADGGFVIVWASDGQDDGQSSGIFGQRFDSNGQAVGTEFQVNTYATSEQDNPTLAVSDDGRFVVVWRGRDEHGTGVFAQRFDGQGIQLGTEFQVNMLMTGNQPRHYATSTFQDDGSLVVVWDSDTSEGDGGSTILARLYDNGALPLGTEFAVNGYTTGSQENPQVARAGDGFVVVWQSSHQDGSYFGVFGQLFGENGSRIGTEFLVNTATFDDQIYPAVDEDSNGGFVVVWTGVDSSVRGILGQRFDGNANSHGTEFPINSYTLGTQFLPSVVMGLEGNFLIVWEGAGPDQDGSASGIFGRRFVGSPPPSLPPTPTPTPTLTPTPFNRFVAGEIRGDNCSPISDPNIPGTCEIISGSGFTLKAFLAPGADCCGLPECSPCSIRYEIEFDEPFIEIPNVQTVPFEANIKCAPFDITAAGFSIDCNGLQGHFIPFNTWSFAASGLFIPIFTPTPSPTHTNTPIPTLTFTVTPSPTLSPTVTWTRTPGNNGSECLNPQECISGFCADSSCCDRACDADNEFCSLPGLEGTCVAVALPTATPTLTATPNLTPQPSGVPCTADQGCLSTFCANGVCCAERCDQEDKSCAVPGFEGQCLEILLSPTPTGTPTSTPSASLTATQTATSTPPPSRTSTVTATRTPTRNPTLVLCVGNCDGGPDVTVNELVRGVNMVLEVQPISSCPVFDPNRDGAVSIDELVRGVNNLLYGCGYVTPTPRPTSTRTRTPTITRTATPFPTPTHTATQVPTETQTPERIQSVCGGFVQSVPRICDLEVIPAVVPRFGSYRIGLCFSDLEGDIAELCLVIAERGVPILVDCIAGPPRGTTVNTCEETALIENDLPVGDYELALNVADVDGNISNSDVAAFLVR